MLKKYLIYSHEQQVAKTPQKPIAFPPWVLHWFLDRQTPPVDRSEPRHGSPLPTVKMLPGACLRAEKNSCKLEHKYIAVVEPKACIMPVKELW
jgi:hypothetical protein